MTYATTGGHPQWLQGPSSASPTIIDLGDHPALSGPSHTPSTAALRDTPLPSREQKVIDPSSTYYAFDSSETRDRSKKRKIERACDFCRRRKTKCDGPQMRGYTCTNCTQNGRECTYNEASKPRGPPKAYVNGLEDRLEKLEALLRRLRPEIYFSNDLGPPIPRGSWKNESPPPTRTTSHSPLIPRLPTTSSLQSNSLVPPAPLLASGSSGSSHSTGPVTIALSNSLPNPISARPSRDSLSQKQKQSSTPIFSDYDDVTTGSESDSEDYGELSLVRGLQGMSLSNAKPLEGSVDPRAMADSQWRFHGKSSSFKLISAARKFQQLHMDEMAKSVPEASSATGSPQAVGNHKRENFWTSPPWETHFGDSGPQFAGILKNQWPNMDLAERLIDMYFAVMNAHFPLLHRPTFNKQWTDRLFERDGWFACLCMSLFAVASRWCHDARVLISEVGDMATPPDESDPIWNSAGWKYVAVAIEFQNSSYSMTLPPSLFEVQTYHNIGLFLRGTPVYTDAWTFVSIGLRKAQDIGAHRKSVYGQAPTVEGELWKRAYWHLVSFDAIASMILGRPCASRDEDFDLDMPLEVDDEYWENDDPALAFQQPRGKPSTVSAFICWIKLTRIAAHALRTLYALEKSKAPLGLVGPRWREETVERLNDAMGDWLEAIPEHLRWSPGIKDPVFASQSATLITTYYMVQIVAHRPFIPMPTALTLGGFNRKHNLAVRPDFPWNCLAICTNAAQATSEIVDAYAHNVNNKNFASMANCCYIAAGVLLVHIWILKAMERAGGGPEGGQKTREQRMRDVTGTLTNLMARLEEVAPKMEIAAMWLGEIKESLPTYDLRADSPTDASMDFKEPRLDRSQSPVPGVSAHPQYQRYSSTEIQPLLTVRTESVIPTKIQYEYPHEGQGSAYPSHHAARGTPIHMVRTPSTPQLYSGVSSATTSGSPYTPVHQWEHGQTQIQADHSQAQIRHQHERHERPASGGSSTSIHGVDATRLIRQQGYIPSLRHYSSQGSFDARTRTPAVAASASLPPHQGGIHDQRPMQLSLPHWYVGQAASGSPMSRSYPPEQGHSASPSLSSTSSHDPSRSSPSPSSGYVPVRVKPEIQEGFPTIPVGNETHVRSPPAILPPFYASAMMNNTDDVSASSLHQQQQQAGYGGQALGGLVYGHPWEYHAYRPQRLHAWRDDPSGRGHSRQQGHAGRLSSSSSATYAPVADDGTGGYPPRY